MFVGPGTVLIRHTLWQYSYRAVNCLTGAGGANGDGDITKSDNLIAFKEYVMEHTDHLGVHFVMGDGVSVVTVCVSFTILVLAL